MGGGRVRLAGPAHADDGDELDGARRNVSEPRDGRAEWRSVAERDDLERGSERGRLFGGARRLVKARVVHEDADDARAKRVT